jgi:hypothetical protein
MNLETFIISQEELEKYEEARQLMLKEMKRGLDLLDVLTLREITVAILEILEKKRRK